LRIVDGSPEPSSTSYTWITTAILLAVASFLGLKVLTDGPSILLLCSAVLLLTAVLSHRVIGKLRSRVAELTRALEEARTDKEEKYENIVLLYQASQATSQETEPGGIMDMVAEDARKLVGCESASVAIFIEKDLLASVTKGISNEFKRNLRWRVRPGGMTDWVLSSGKPLLIADAAKDARSRESSAVRIGKQRSIMAVPLSVEDEVFGIMYAGDTGCNKFDDHDLMLLTILANHAAASIKQARLRRELRKKLEELETAHKELIGADRLKAEFISAVTSQMRIPLDAIKTYSETVLERVDDSSFRLKKKFLGAVVEESAKLLNTVNGVIDLSRMEFGEGDLRKEEVHITDVLKDVCRVLDPLCIDREVEMVVDTPSQISPAYLDKGMIFLMFRNLIEAAISFSRGATSIRIAIEEDESFLKTRVSLVPSTASIEMEAAIQAISTRDVVPSEAGSLGLALQVAKNIVFRHGGRIWAETHDPACWSLVVLFGKERKAIMPSDLMLEIMTSRPELKRMLALVTDMISKVMEVGRCQLLLEDSTTGNLMLGASINFKQSDDSMFMVGANEGLSGKVYQQSIPVALNSEQELADLGVSGTLAFERVPCACVPIRLKGRAVGVLTVSDKHNRSDFFDEDDLGLLAALGDRIAVAIERATSYESARDQFVSAMVAMKSVLEARRAPAGKAADHTRLVMRLGRVMGLGEEDVRLLQYVSRIYDVGMVKVGEGILRKRGGLRVGEYESVKRHPEEGVNIVGPIEFLEQVKEIILHHHERYDGGGYPGGLVGERIPMGARILAVVDAYSSMLSDRSYRPAMSEEEALEELSRCSGTQFDPKVVEKLIEIMRKATAETQSGERV
jgi:K+-sensing histidine kinase KdpD